MIISSNSIVPSKGNKRIVRDKNSFGEDIRHADKSTSTVIRFLD